MRNLFISLALLCTFLSCKDKPKSKYEACCGAQPTLDSVEVNVPDPQGGPLQYTIQAHVYIPNVFTPGDFDGINDVFHINFGEGIELIQYAVFQNDAGDTLFHRKNYLPDQDDLSDGWSGQNPDGTFHYGLFTYHVRIKFLNGPSKNYEGEACSFKCGDEGFPSENLPDCFFPSQHLGNGEADKNLPGSPLCF